MDKAQLANRHADELAKHGLFAVAQELEQIERFYREEIANEDEFTADEKVRIHANFNLILVQLNEQGILTPEIEKDVDILKESLYLGKNKWIKLFIGTTATLLFEKAIDKSIVDIIFNGVFKGVEYLQGAIGNILIDLL